MGQNIELHIEELVLRGFPDHNADQVGEAVQQEITRLLLERGLPAGLAAEATIGRLHTDSFTLQPTTKAEVVGHDIATSVYQGLAK